MSRATNGKGKSKMSVSEAASRVGQQVSHTGQGQDERARRRSLHLLHGLDSAWSVVSNPQRESGTRWWAAADVGAGQGQVSRSAQWRRGNRLGDSVGAYSPRTDEELRSAQSSQKRATGRGGWDSGDVLSGCMSQLRRFKGRGAIAGLAHPHAIDDAHPHIGQGAHGHAVAFPFCSLALVVGPCPALLSRGLPGELVQGVAQRLAAGEAFMRFGVIAALERHRRGSSQRLHGGGISIAAALIAPFGEHAWSQALARTRQRAPDLLVSMTQKKGADSFVIASELLDHDQQLLNQREHQARLGAHDDLSGTQVGTVQFLDDLGSHAHRARMLPHTQGDRDLFQRSRLSCLGCRVGLQKHEGGALLQFGKQVQSRRIVLLETGCQLVHQAPLGLDQCILIARQGFQFLHAVTIGLQSTQLGQVKAAYFRQHMRVNLIGLGSCRFAQLIGRLGVDRIDGNTSFQQERDQQAMVRARQYKPGVQAQQQYSARTASTRSNLHGCGQSAALLLACQLHPAPLRHGRVGRWRVFIHHCTLTIEYDTFPSASRRTGLDTFASSGSPVTHHSRCGIAFKGRP